MASAKYAEQSKHKIFKMRTARLVFSFVQRFTFEVQVITKAIGNLRSFVTAYGEVKRRPFFNFTFGPDMPPVFRNDPVHNGETDARSFEFMRGVQALKYAEEFIIVEHIKPGAVVADEKHNISILHFRADMNDRPFLLAGIL